MQAVRITENVYWVGAIDWNMRNFHGYSTPRGSSYNSYLILDEVNVLIDTVKKQFFDHLVQRISSIIDPQEIDVIIANHAEPDHSSSLPLVQRLTNAKVMVSERGEDIFRLLYGDMEMETVTDGQEMDIGSGTLRFIHTPMLHWPDSMFTYLVEEGVLFSMDGFGQHYASSKRFDDEARTDVLMQEFAIYYANILMPYGKQAMKALERVGDLDISLIAPSHGVIWRENIAGAVECYRGWADHQTSEKAVVLYDTMWQSTERMACAIAEGIAAEGVQVRLLRASDTDRSEIMHEILDSRAVAVGSPTLNNGLFPTIADRLTYMMGLRPKGRIGLAFGSYGWGGGAVKVIHEMLEKSGMDLPLEDIELRYAGSDENIARCKRAGRELAKLIKADR
jgi:anaerobic nitric oxide reductase flavorubredoxin